ncbi:MAG: hypothetical protein H7A01_10645 [Hahellaceae bacterium]|nr:hypothetical protein [Hahellaceae bacterium]MCP5211061.1 hypothetical protein [Hahellaceae bacterium]
MTIKKIIAPLIMLLFIYAQSSGAETLKDSAQVANYSQKFITLIESDKAADAYDVLSPFVTASSQEFDGIKSKALSNIEMIKAELGKPLSSQFLKRESVADHFERHSYLVKYRKAAIVWQVTWYQPDSGWQVIAVNFSANVDPFYTVKP